MKSHAKCSGCGEALPPDALDGLCPRCLLGLIGPMAPKPELAPTNVSENSPPSSAEMGPLPPHFGDYELVEEIARGGMGVVYKARQKSLNRTVAVKMILAGQFAGKQMTQRFRGEAAAAGTLQHPNIVAIHEIGMHEGQHFFSMDFVEGQNLAQLVGNRPLPAQQAVRYVKLIAEAIHYAHQQGILHRDLKPSNVLIDAATDQPRVTDFGLAKRLDGESSITVTGQVLGSPNFMPPEQASGKRGKVGRHSDVYGLGGILYYTLTARAPFQGATLETTIHEVLNTEPLSPRALNPSVQPDLETICLKCLEKEQGERYATARELSDELGRFLNDEPIHARPVSQLERGWRWCRRKPALAGSLTAATIFLLILAVGAPIAALRINREARRAEKEAQRAEREALANLRNLYASDMNLANLALENNDLRRARELLDKHAPTAKGAPDLRAWEWRYLYGESHRARSQLLGRLAGPVSTVCFSPDRKWVAAVSDPDGVRIWDYATRQLIDFSIPSRIGISSSEELAHTLCFSPDSSLLAAGGADNSIVLWHMDSRRKVATLDGNNSATMRVAFTKEGYLLASLSNDGVARLWRINGTSAERISEWKAGAKLSALAISPDGKILATAGEQKPIKLWDISDPGAPREAASIDVMWTLSLAFSPDGRRIAVCGTQMSSIELWDFPGLTELKPLRGFPGMHSDVTFSPDGRYLSAVGGNAAFCAWDLSDPGEKQFFVGHDENVLSVAFSSDAKTIVSGAVDGTVRLWEVGGKQEGDLRIPSWLHDAVFSPDTRYVAVLAAEVNGSQGRLVLWDVAAGRVANFWDGPRGPSGQIDFSPDSKTLAVSCGGTTWHLEVPSLRVTRQEPADRVLFSVDGRFTIAARKGKLLRRNLQSSNEVELSSHFPSPLSMKMSPDGNWLAASTAWNEELSLWQMDRLDAPVRLSGHKRPIWIRFSPDNKTLASASWDGTVGLWDIRSGTNITFIKGHSGELWSLAFSPDGRTLAFGGEDNTIRLWNLESLQESATLHGHAGPVTGLDFSADGKRLASIGGWALRLWHAPTFKEIATAPAIK